MLRRRFLKFLGLAPAAAATATVAKSKMVEVDTPKLPMTKKERDEAVRKMVQEYVHGDVGTTIVTSQSLVHLHFKQADYRGSWGQNK